MNLPQEFTLADSYEQMSVQKLYQELYALDLTTGNEITLSAEDYQRLGGHLGHAVSLRDVVTENNGEIDLRPWRPDNPWPWRPVNGS